MAAKKTQKVDTVEQTTEEIKETVTVIEEIKVGSAVISVTFDPKKIKEKYGFMPSSLYIAGRVITPDRLTFELPTEQVKNIKDLIKG